MKSFPLLRAAASSLPLLAVLACDIGTGSEVPPFLPGGPETYVSALVINQVNQPIIGALASVEGGANTAASLRNGRFYLPDQPVGQARMTVDPQNGTATASDEYAKLVYRPGIPGGKAALGRAIVLPDLKTGTSSNLSLGTLTSPVVVDGSATAGARLDLATGTILSQGTMSGTVKVSLARVEKDQLSLDLPGAASGILLSGRGIWLTPVDLVFAGGTRSLTIDNDLGLSVGQQASLMRLDPVAGSWIQVGTGTVKAGGTEIQSDGGVLPGGGIYVYTTSVSVGLSTQVSGKVVDQDGKAIAGAHVVVGEAPVVFTNAQGDFLVRNVAQQNRASVALQLPILVMPPLGYSPAVKRLTRAAIPGSTPLGTIQTDAHRVTNIQSIAVIRGRGLGNARVLHGGGGQAPFVYQAQGSGKLSTDTVTQSGVITRRDVPLGWYRAWHTFELNRELYRQQEDLVLDLNPDEEFNGMPVYVRIWRAHAQEVDGRTLNVVVDSEGGAPLNGAIVQSPTIPTTNRYVTVAELGSIFNTTTRFEDQTAVYESKLGTKTLRSALTTGSIDNYRVEYPLLTLRQPQLGQFEPFGMIQGKLLSSVAGKDRKALPQPGYSANDWFNLALTGKTYTEALPRLLEPSSSSQDYLLGLALQKASLVVSEGVTTAGTYTPERLGVLTGLRPSAGSRIVQDLDLSLALSNRITLQDVLLSLDGRIGNAALRYQLGVTLDPINSLDLLPLSAGITTNGNDALVPVPPLSGPLTGGTFLLAVGGAGTASGITVSQHLYLTTQGPALIPGGFLAAPTITSPAANSTVTKTGFDVTWTAPSGTYFFELNLSSINGTNDRHWKVYLPVTRTSFHFGALIAQAPQILEGGRTWTLSVTAYSIDRGVALGEPTGYQGLIGNLFSLRPGERGLKARSVYQQTIMTAP